MNNEFEKTFLKHRKLVVEHLASKNKLITESQEHEMEYPSDLEIDPAKIGIDSKYYPIYTGPVKIKFEYNNIDGIVEIKIFAGEDGVPLMGDDNKLIKILFEPGEEIPIKALTPRSEKTVDVVTQKAFEDKQEDKYVSWHLSSRGL